MILNYTQKFLVVTFCMILISSSSVDVFAEIEFTQEQLENGRYSIADPNGSGVGEGASSDDKTKHQHYYSQNKNESDSSIAEFNVGANVLNGCNCVVFRLDDVQDFWLPDVQITVMDQFVQKNQYLSAGPIVAIFGADSTVVDKVVDGYNSGLFEIFVHGWDHVDYSGLNLATQTSTLQDSQDKLQLIFGSPSNIFIPPYNAFNANTLTALQSTDFEILSAAEYTDSYPYFIADGSSNVTDSLGLYHLPETIGFVEYDDNDIGIRVPINQILDSIDSSINSKGYAVVTLHSQEFAELQGGSEINSVDQNLLDDLNSIINGVLLKNYSIRTFNQVVQYNQFQTPDTEKPVITPLGTSMSIPFTSVYTELGATVTDNDPSYSEAVVIGGDTVDTLIPGDYIVTYNAPSDDAGNVPDEQTITITVVPPSITINDVDLFEGGPGITNFEFTVTRSSNINSISVDFSTTDNTAMAPFDYLPRSLGTLNFTSGGSLTTTILVSVIGENIIEEDESFYVNLSNCVGGCIISDNQGIGNILDDDTPPPLFSDSFELDLTKWIQTGEGDWNIENPSEIQVPGYQSNLVAHSDNCDSTCTLTMSAPLDLRLYSSATLSFWRFVDDLLDDGEYLKVELYNGTHWNMVANWTKNAGNDNAWHHEIVNLDSYLNTSEFNVRFVSHESGSQEEVEIDNVAINIVPIPACDSMPTNGDWIIISTCLLENDFTSPQSVKIQNGAVLIISNGVILTIPSGNNITIELGGGALVKSGGTLQINP